MKISKKYISPVASDLLSKNPSARTAYLEIEKSIIQNVSPDSTHFILNSSKKHINGVVPVKEGIYVLLEHYYNWYREKKLPYLKKEAKKGGPIDVYKEFNGNNTVFKVGLEFETGNISSAHRSMNKLCIGVLSKDIDLAILIMPIFSMAYYLTDRISNYEELEPYFKLLESYPFIVIGFDADEYNPNAAPLPKGSDGMSKRAIHKWKE